MQVAATLRNARISPQKCRLVADAIRGKNVDEAIEVNEAPTLKRFRARAKGRGTRIIKRNSHIIIRLGDE